MRRTILGSIVSAAVLAAACGSTSTPTAPTTPAPAVSVTAVNIASASPTGTTFQLTAMASLADGTSRDVTSTAVWQSSNTSVATVSAAGVVTVRSTGEIDVKATYVNVSGSIHLLVSPSPTGGTASLLGLVRAVPPSSLPIAGARVEIIAGPDTGKFVLADTSGAYRFDGLTVGRLSLHVTADTYQDWAIGNLPVGDAATSQDAFLYPVPPRDSSGAPPTARCNDGSWTWISDTDAGCSAHSGVAYTLAPGTDKPSVHR